MRRTVIFVGGLLLIGALSLLAYRHALDDGSAGGGTLTVISPDRDIGSQPCGEWVTVRFRIENSSPHAIPVVGAVSG